MDAVALLRLSFDQLHSVLRLEAEKPDATIFRATGRSLEARELEDGSTLNLALRFGTPEDTLGAVLRNDLGALVEAHGDERGVFIYPSVAELEATTYDAAIEELGEGGMWVTVPAAEDARVGPADAAGALQGLMGGLGPDLLGQVEQMMGSFGAGGDDEAGGMSEGFAEIAKGFLENDEMRGMLEGMAAQMFGGGQAPADIMNGDLMAKARAMAEQATADNPELAAKAEELARKQPPLDPATVAELAGKLGLELPSDDDDDQ